MDHENLVVVLRLLLELGRREMTKPPAIGVVTSGTVATAVTEASTRAVRQQMVMIADQVAWHVQKRSKWCDGCGIFDPPGLFKTYHHVALSPHPISGGNI